MAGEPVIVTLDEREWETWPPEQAAQRGDASWKTLISAGLTESSTLTLGVGRLPPGGVLREHHHQQAEVYLVLDDTGVVTIDGAARPIAPGAAVFVPGGALHSVRCTGTVDLRIAYAFAADSFEQIEYVFAA